MSRNRGWFQGMAAVLLALWAVSASEARERPGGFGPPSREQLEMVRMWRLVETLAIDEAQATKLFPVFGRYRRERAELVAARQKMRGVLREQLRQTAGDDDLLGQVARIRKIDADLKDLERDLQKELGPLLTPQQQARLLLFEDGFRQDLQDMVRRMRGGMMVPGDDSRERMSRRRWQEND